MSARSRARTATFAVGALALSLLGLEVVSGLIHTAVRGDIPSPAASEDARRELWQSPGDDRPTLAELTRPTREQDENNVQALHPYVGYVLDPEASRSWPVNAYGFLGDAPPFETGNAESVSIAILGGSVAENMTIFAHDVLRGGLGEIEAFRGKDLRITCLALRGMKQPQQLMTVDWFLSLGAHFDVVINLDGFNEVVLAGENALQGTYPFYPRRWKLRMRGLPDAESAAAAGQTRFLEELRKGVARGVSASIVRYTLTGNLIWDLTDRWLATQAERTRSALNETLLSRSETNVGYEATGPPAEYDDDSARARALAAFWRRASVLLHQRAQADGFRYFHFLQPNQHVPNSKPFSSAERKVALPGNYFFREMARTGYAELIAAGRTLAAEGVDYTDLTRMFEDVDEPLYSDPCCHFNRRGYELIADAISSRVREAYARGAAR